MRDVVVIGAGLTGLAAAYELEQHKVDYTLIEVKRQLGGSIHTVQEAGFTMDLGAFAIADTLDKTWLDSLGLANDLHPITPHSVAFNHGTVSFVKAIESRLTAPRLMRMAVSSIGELENGRCAICLENGILLDAKTVILAVPARYAQRMFYGYITPITEMLLDYEYDTIHRVALGFHTDDIPAQIDLPPDMGFAFIHRTSHPTRVPQGHTLLQFGIRLAPNRVESLEQMVAMLREDLNLPEPVVAKMGFWSEADPVSCYYDSHAAWVQALREKLPERVTLIGSDYCLQPPAHKGIARLDERITQGRIAAQNMLKFL
jgi:protoporphyrinogen oxidase